MGEFQQRRFGSYWLVLDLGEGGMGAVYLARREGVDGIDRMFVVKTMRGVLAGEGDFLERFLDEARLASRLNDRNICSVFDVGLFDGQHYLAMNWFTGSTSRCCSNGCAAAASNCRSTLRSTARAKFQRGTSL